MALLKAGGGKNRFVGDDASNDRTKASLDDFMRSDTVFAGTPDDVYAQIKDFNDRMGGIGHILFFGQGGHLDHRDTVENITLFAREVLPRVRELSPDTITRPRAIAAE